MPARSVFWDLNKEARIADNVIIKLALMVLFIVHHFLMPSWIQNEFDPTQHNRQHRRPQKTAISAWKKLTGSLMKLFICIMWQTRPREAKAIVDKQRRHLDVRFGPAQGNVNTSKGSPTLATATLLPLISIPLLFFIWIAYVPHFHNYIDQKAPSSSVRLVSPCQGLIRILVLWQPF